MKTHVSLIKKNKSIEEKFTYKHFKIQLIILLLLGLVMKVRESSIKLVVHQDYISLFIYHIKFAMNNYLVTRRPFQEALGMNLKGDRRLDTNELHLLLQDVTTYIYVARVGTNGICSEKS